MKRFYPATIFGISFGFLEAIVVVYLRKIYYPEGFSFPLTLLEPEMIKIEIFRELMTIIMLASFGWILGKKFGERFSFFIFTFGVWDIFYYIGLKLFLNWPENLLTWDVLFLIPITWVGPVLAPVICSIGMILIALIYIYVGEKNYEIKFSVYHLVLISVGVLIIIYTFIYDYFTLMTENNFWGDWTNLVENEKFWQVVQNFIPTKFKWIEFSIGCALISIGYALCFIGSVKKEIKPQ